MKQLLCFLLSLICSIGALTGNAQSDTCITHLKEAQTDIDDGDFDEAIATLNISLHHCWLGKPDKITAYKLLILSLISIDKLEDADKAAKEVMKLDPLFTPDKFKDDSKLIDIFKKYKPKPVFGIGISGGINMPVEKTKHQYSVFYPDGQAPASYKPKIGFQLAVAAEKKAYKNLWIELGATFRKSSYEHLLFDVDSTTIDYTEKLTYLDIPLSLKYFFPLHRFIPYAEAGACFSYMASALGTTTRPGAKEIVDRIALRNTYQTGYFGCAGISYNIKTFLLFIDARYILFPKNVNKDGTRFNDPVNLFQFYYLDDDFKLDNLQFNAGIAVYLIYKNVRL